MQDHASPHNSAYTKAFLNERGIRLLWWPEKSPDLNPIEHVWRILKQRVQKRFPRSKADLRQYLQEEWAKLSIQDLWGLTQNMGERSQAVRDAGGYPTKY